MRSVVVVLPASMCAMIPMFRVFSSGKLRAMVPFVGVEVLVSSEVLVVLVMRGRSA
jgi:hypothetical protein